jgi:hypothetical protein
MPLLRKKNRAENFWGAPSPGRILVLVVGLLLAFMFLAFMTATVNSIVRLSQAVGDMRIDIAGLRQMIATENASLAAGQKAAAEVPAKPLPPVLFSVVRFGAGEQATLDSDLVGPLLSYYAAATEGSPLSAVLIERKNVASHDVNVRLFFADGTETDYLWPSTHSSAGIWTPPPSAQ